MKPSKESLARLVRVGATLESNVQILMISPQYLEVGMGYASERLPVSGHHRSVSRPDNNEDASESNDNDGVRISYR